MRSRFLRLMLVGFLSVAGCKPAAGPPPRAPASANPPATAPAPSASGPRQVAAPERPRRPAFWETAAEGASGGGSNVGPRPYVPLPKPQIEDRKVEAAGIRKLAGKRLVLYTDVPSSLPIDGLCELADQAYPQWCRYFQLSEQDDPDWQLTGYLMKDQRRFQGAGLWPENLPEFKHGFCRDQEFWLYDQPTDYYRRHLLLHEMTHGFMYTRLKAAAPPWYQEGICELLATHRLREGRLELNYFPQHKEETPDWGRIKLMQEGFAAATAPLWEQVLQMPLEAHLKVENYAWSWAAAALLDGHPRYRERFRQVARDVGKPDFDQRFRALFADDWRDLLEDWQLFVGGIEYGYDLQRSAIDYQSGKDLPASGAKFKIAADKSWQSSRVYLRAGETYRIRASGRYELAQMPQPWISEPNGVSIRYYKGAPLGILLAALRSDDPDPSALSRLFRVDLVGLEATITPAVSGTLYLRINDSNAELSDNRGELEVELLSEKQP